MNLWRGYTVSFKFKEGDGPWTVEAKRFYVLETGPWWAFAVRHLLQKAPEWVCNKLAWIPGKISRKTLENPEDIHSRIKIVESSPLVTNYEEAKKEAEKMLLKLGHMQGRFHPTLEITLPAQTDQENENKPS